MHKKYFVTVEEFCRHHGIEVSLISNLQRSGMVKITTVKENRFIDSNQLQQLERIILFNNELEINLEGIEAINHLLQRMTELQDEITDLRNRLGFFEDAIIV